MAFYYGIHNLVHSLMFALGGKADTGLAPMSAIGPKRTSKVAPHMSALGGKADMPFCAAYVGF